MQIFWEIYFSPVYKPFLNPLTKLYKARAYKMKFTVLYS